MDVHQQILESAGRPPDPAMSRESTAEWSWGGFVLAQLRLLTLVTLFSFISTRVSMMLLPSLYQDPYDSSSGKGTLDDLTPFTFTLSEPSRRSIELVEGDKLEKLVEDVREMFDRSFTGYMTHAFPMDDLKPISCTGSNSQGGMAITLLDSLDMLYLMKRGKDLRKAVLYISKSLSFDIDARIHVFEVTIRALGGLLSGHVLLKQDSSMVPWYKQELLDQAVNLADRLLPAFDTATGVPEAWLNLHSGKIPGETKDTCTACAGTMVLEFGVLSRLTGNPVYEQKARDAMVYMYRQRSVKGLVGTWMNTLTGQWSNQVAGVGASIDSYYEYLLKAYLMFGDSEYLDMFVELYASNKAYATLSERVNGMVWPVDVHMTSGRVMNPFISSLGAFWPGMQAMAGQIEDASKLFWHWDVVRKKFGYIPESFTADLTATHPTMAYYPLRPEHIESGYMLYALTRNKEFMAAVAEFHVALNGTRVTCGYSSVGDVPSSRLDDMMESFFISETLKYLYLLFSERTDVLDQYVLSTEAHFLPTFPRPSNSSRHPKNMEERSADRVRPCAAVCLAHARIHPNHQQRHTLPIVDDSFSRIQERRCDVCLALAEAIPEKKERALYEWRAASKHPIKSRLVTSAPRALGLEEEEHFHGMRHFLCAMVYDKTTNTADCRILREVSMKDMSSQSFQMLPPDTVMFQLKGQRRREVDFLAKHMVNVEVATSTGTTTIPAVLGQLGDRFFPGCNTSSDMEALRLSWSMEMDAMYALDWEEQRPWLSFDQNSKGTSWILGWASGANQSPSMGITDAMFIPRIPACQKTGSLVISQPIDACSPVENVDEVRNSIVLMKRGNCTFQTKAIHAEAAKARAMIIVNDEGLPFAMEPDPNVAAGHPPVTIPCVMVGSSDGRYLLANGKDANAEVTILQPEWEERVGQAMDTLFGLSAGGPGDAHASDTCLPAPSLLANTTRREHILYEYESQLPMQLDMVFASRLSRVQQQVHAANFKPVLDKLARMYT